MSLETNKKIRLIYGIVLSVLVVLAGVCLMVACMQIYQSGGGVKDARPFTPESVAEAFECIAIPIWLCVGGIAVGALLTLCIPLEENKKIKGRVDPQVIITRLRKKVNFANCDEALLKDIKKEKNCRLIVNISASVVSALMATPAVFCFAQPTKFAPEGDADNVVVAVCCAFFGAVVALAAWVGATFLKAHSLQKELALIKQAFKVSPLANIPQEDVAINDKHVALWTVRGVVLAAAVVLMILGITGGGTTDVWENAVRICSSCIGLG